MSTVRTSGTCGKCLTACPVKRNWMCWNCRTLLKTVSKHKDICLLERRPVKPSRTANEIISGMSPRSLDYSQQCINYFVSRIAEKTRIQNL